MDLYPKQYLYRRLVKPKLFIDDNFPSNIGLNQIADEACLSKFHFVRLFKSIYGCSPHQYLIKVRVENAKQRLGNGYSVKEACYMVGFDSISSFAGLFKRRVGQTRAAFCSERQALKAEIARKPLEHTPNCFSEKKGWRKHSNFRETETLTTP